MRIEKYKNPIMLHAVFHLCIYALVCVSCTNKMYVVSVEVSPEPGTVLKDNTTKSERDDAHLLGYISTSMGEIPIVGAGVNLVNLENGHQKNIGGTYTDGSFLSSIMPGVYSMSVVHMDYNLFGPYIIELKSGMRREVHVDLSRGSTFEKVDTLHGSKRLSMDDIRSLIIQKNTRLRTVAPDSILVKVLK